MFGASIDLLKTLSPIPGQTPSPPYQWRWVGAEACTFGRLFPSYPTPPHHPINGDGD